MTQLPYIAVQTTAIECDMGLYRYTSHSKNHCSECAPRWPRAPLILHKKHVFFDGLSNKTSQHNTVSYQNGGTNFLSDRDLNSG